METTQEESWGCIDSSKSSITVISSDTSEVPKIKLSVTKWGIQTHKETSLILGQHFKNAKDSMLSSYLFKRKFKDLDLQQVDIPGDGYCFLSSILIVLGEKGVTKTFKQLSIEISEELHDNLHTYCEFLSDEERNMLLVAANFFQAGVYNTNVDILVGCAANALNVNLNIIQYMAGKYNLTSYDSKKGSRVNLYFLLSQTKKVDSNAHYYAIIMWHFYKQNQEFIMNAMVQPDDSCSIETFKNTVSVSSQSNVGAIDQNTSTHKAATVSQSSKVTRRVTRNSSKTCNTSTEKR